MTEACQSSSPRVASGGKRLMHCFKALNMLVSWHHGQLIANHHKNCHVHPCPSSMVDKPAFHILSSRFGVRLPLSDPSSVPRYPSAAFVGFASATSWPNRGRPTPPNPSPPWAKSEQCMIDGLAARLIQAPPAVAATMQQHRINLQWAAGSCVYHLTATVKTILSSWIDWRSRDRTSALTSSYT